MRPMGKVPTPCPVQRRECANGGHGKDPFYGSSHLTTHASWSNFPTVVESSNAGRRLKPCRHCALPSAVSFSSPASSSGQVRHSGGGCFCHCCVWAVPSFLRSLSIVVFHWIFPEDGVPTTEPRRDIKQKNFLQSSRAERGSWDSPITWDSAKGHQLAGRYRRHSVSSESARLPLDGITCIPFSVSVKEREKTWETRLASPLPLPHSSPDWRLWDVNQCLEVKDHQECTCS